MVKALGENTTAAFCRLFIWADRLTSAQSLVLASRTQHGVDSVGFRRNLDALIWYTVGCMREAGLAIQGCRSALAKRQLLGAESPIWKQLGEREKRWNQDPTFREMRNKAAFHFDQKVAERGIEKIGDTATPGARITLAHGDGGSVDSTILTLGTVCLFNGLYADPAEYRRFLDRVTKDLTGFNQLVYEASCEALKKAGIPIVDDGRLPCPTRRRKSRGRDS